MVQMASDIERLYIDEEVRDVFLQAYEEDYERKSDLACDVVDCGYLLPPVKCIMDNGDKCYKGGVVDNKGNFVASAGIGEEEFPGRCWKDIRFLCQKLLLRILKFYMVVF